MYILDFYDILFFIKALKQPSDHFNIHHHVSFSTSNTRSASTNKLNPTHIINFLAASTSCWQTLNAIDIHLRVMIIIIVILAIVL